MSELKPSPFCGDVYIDDDWFGIYCGKKQVFKPNFNFKDWEKEAEYAVMAINSHDSMVEQLAKLQEEVAEFKAFMLGLELSSEDEARMLRMFDKYKKGE